MGVVGSGTLSNSPNVSPLFSPNLFADFDDMKEARDPGSIEARGVTLLPSWPVVFTIAKYINIYKQRVLLVNFSDVVFLIE